MSHPTLPEFPDEIVTSALLRYVAIPSDPASADRTSVQPSTVAFITLDNGHDHTRPSTFGPKSLQALSDAIDAIEQRLVSGEPPAAVCVTGKPFVFSVGADLKVLRQLRSREQVVEIGRLGHKVFRRLGELPVPSFAFINGAALGGGLELALHCTYRTVDSSARALALPEVFLGLIPGWGGTYLLPHLIGTARAAQVILSNPLNYNTMLTPAQALELGVVDAMFAPADFLEQSLSWTADVLSGEIDVARKPTDVDIAETEWNAPLDFAKREIDARVREAAPAPYRAIELMRAARSSTRDEAFAAEDQALADLTTSPELAASLYAFDLVNKRAKHPAGVPQIPAASVSFVGILGAGLMACQLALLFARRLDVAVHLIDVDDDRATAGLAAINKELAKLEGKGRISPDLANRLQKRITSGTDIRALADTDFVIEAVFENLEVKQQALAAAEAVVADNAVLASNTSSLSITKLASGLKHPERFIGFHFFNPVAVMQLVEIVRGEFTDDATVATSFDVAKRLKKSAVLVNDAPAFVVNRLLARLLNEVLASVDEGTSLEVAEGAISPLGLPMTPLNLLDLVGPAVALHVSQTMKAAFPDRFTVSPNLERIVGERIRAFYTVQGEKSVLDQRVLELIDQGDRPQTAEQLRERVLSAVADEIDVMLADGVIGHAQDIDLCLLLGAGWPFWLGGITPYLDRCGVQGRRAGHRYHRGLPQAIES